MKKIVVLMLLVMPIIVACGNVEKEDVPKEEKIEEVEAEKDVYDLVVDEILNNNVVKNYSVFITETAASGQPNSVEFDVDIEFIKPLLFKMREAYDIEELPYGVGITVPAFGVMLEYKDGTVFKIGGAGPNAIWMALPGEEQWHCYYFEDDLVEFMYSLVKEYEK